MRNKVSTQAQKKAPPPGEVRAFIYQQLSEIQSLLPEGSVVQVSVSAVEPKKPKNPCSPKRNLTQAEIQVDSIGGRMVATAQDKDEYWAILEARAKMEKQIKILEDTQFYSGEEAREDLVEAITSKQYLH